MLEWIWRRCKWCQLGILINFLKCQFSTINMHFLLHLSKTIYSFQCPNVVLIFFLLKRFLSFPHFQLLYLTGLLVCLHPVFIWHFLVYWGLPQQRGVFQAKKIPQRKKINPAAGKKRNCCRRSCKQSEKYLGIIGKWSTQKEREIGLPKEPLAPIPQMRCLWQGSHLPPLNGQ